MFCSCSTFCLPRCPQATASTCGRRACASGALVSRTACRLAPPPLPPPPLYSPYHGLAAAKETSRRATWRRNPHPTPPRPTLPSLPCPTRCAPAHGDNGVVAQRLTCAAYFPHTRAFIHTHTTHHTTLRHGISLLQALHCSLNARLLLPARTWNLPRRRTLPRTCCLLHYGRTPCHAAPAAYHPPPALRVGCVAMSTTGGLAPINTPWLARLAIWRRRRVVGAAGAVWRRKPGGCGAVVVEPLMVGGSDNVGGELETAARCALYLAAPGGNTGLAAYPRNIAHMAAAVWRPCLGIAPCYQRFIGVAAWAAHCARTRVSTCAGALPAS